MKKAQILFSVLFFCLKLSAQTEFMPIGSTSYTTFSAFRSEGSATFKPQKDTLCDGAPCRKISIARKNKRTNQIFEENLFIQQRGDSIFEYTTYDKKWAFLFKNRYKIGDSFDIKQNIVNYSFTVATVYIDSVIESNGVIRYASTIKCLPRSSEFQLFYTRFNLYNKFLPDYHWQLYGICWEAYNDGFYYQPLCFIDNGINYHTPKYTGSCDSIAQRVDTTNITTDLDLTLFPNPTDANLFIKSSQTQSVHLKMFNIHGQLVLEKTMTTSFDMDVRQLPNGVYIIKAETDKGLSKTQKLIVHH